MIHSRAKSTAGLWDLFKASVLCSLGSYRKMGGGGGCGERVYKLPRPRMKEVTNSNSKNTKGIIKL